MGNDIVAPVCYNAGDGCFERGVGDQEPLTKWSLWLSRMGHAEVKRLDSCTSRFIRGF